MKQTVTESMFKDEFMQIRPDNFSWGGLSVLWDHLEEYEEETGEEMELDVIGLCCDFSEDSAEDIARSYDIDIDGLDEEEIEEAVRDYLQDEGAYIGETDCSFIYRDF